MKTLLSSALFLLFFNGGAMGNSAFIFIEYQNEWIANNGKLRKMFVNDKALKNVLTNSSNILAKLRENKNNKVVHVAMMPDSKYKIFGEANAGLRKAIPDYRTWQGSLKNFYEDFVPTENEFAITERSGASAFSGTTLESYLRNNKVDKIYLLGFAGHVCVESTLRDAHDKGFETYVVKDALLFFKDEQRKYFFKNIVHHFGHAKDSKNLLGELTIKNFALNTIDTYFKSVKNINIKPLRKTLSNDFKMQGVVGKSAISINKKDLIARVASMQKDSTKRDEYHISNIFNRNGYYLFDIRSKVGGNHFLDQIYVNKKDGKIKLKTFIEGKEK